MVSLAIQTPASVLSRLSSTVSQTNSCLSAKKAHRQLFAKNVSRRFISFTAPLRSQPQLQSQSRAPSRSSRYCRNTIYALCFASIGYTLGSWINHNYLGGVYEPGTPADMRRLAEIQAAFEKLEVTKRLRDDKEKWEEYEPYTNLSDAERQGALSTGCLNGSRAMGFQRIFWSATEKKVISIIYLGNAVTGWPGTIHGGLQAIILDEALARGAIRILTGGTGVTANLNIDYKSRMAQNQFYKVVIEVNQEKSTERKAFVDGCIEGLDGKVYTKASALFVVPKKLKLRKLEEKF
ncbi:hypothetical protein KEM54_002053 [Ascosphaera aggregata]|nr:hypothetical protein KEM54_002053 [Ascosphaera aggregata]